MSTPAKNAPVFQRIKDYLLREIQSGTWKEGDAIPSEAALAEQFSVSRMTVNRAVRELTSEQILTRIQGSGTYVAQHKYQATLVEIKSIAEEVRARGHTHRSELHQLEAVKATDILAQQFKVKIGHSLFHSVIVHFENEVAIQVEDRWVNSAIAPDYLEQDFASMTPNEYLMVVAPLESVSYRIEALLPPKHIGDMLHITYKEPCLLLHRQTLSKGKIATIVTMWHPGLRYQFAGSF
ncbi:histidine utilization repressor [Undibacterium sp. Jales W-56]|uniref:histidine utilization repressor n=1 Tax=Undibacterium sp. Jales W-56 TaxID=2897325 RepID=UPI0021CF02E6|nr:histidine utilization repressor [Undibacterium sp. Jales W-56]MCU6432939.1 histidine utilization repressor [Undibacterium sp. Jales W-56]